MPIHYYDIIWAILIIVNNNKHAANDTFSIDQIASIFHAIKSLA